MESFSKSAHAGQLHLFDPNAYLVARPRVSPRLSLRTEESNGASIEGDLQGRPGFVYDAIPKVFGCRHGGGPLLAGLDTSILIELRKGLEDPEGDLGFLVQPLWSDLETLQAALRDLLQLWWWRDVRFWVGDVLLEDARKPLKKTYADARELALEELRRDLWERGDFPQEAARLGQSSPDFSAVNPGVHSHDFQIVKDALQAGCHVLLTGDKGMRRWNRFVSPHGLVILTIGELMESLDQARELDHCSAMALDAPAPDIAPMSRLYVGFG